MITKYKDWITFAIIIMLFFLYIGGVIIYEKLKYQEAYIKFVDRELSEKNVELQDCFRKLPNEKLISRDDVFHITWINETI